MTYDPNVAIQQSSLNAQNQGKAGYVPLKVDGMLGPLTQSAIQQYGYNTQTGQPNTPSTPSTPTTPSTPVTPSTPSTPTTPASGNSYLDQVTALEQLSPAEVNDQTQLNQLQANATQGQFNVSQQPIAQGFISGQQSAMQTQANIAQQPLQNQLALAQSQRQAALSAAQTALDYQKPTALAYGSSLINPVTGATINGGVFGNASSSSANNVNSSTGLTSASSTADIMGYLAKNGVNVTRYDAPGLINAVQNGATAQDIISGKANVAGAISGAGVAFNPATGGFQQKMPSLGSSGATSSGYSAPTPSGQPISSGGADKSQIEAVQKALGIGVDGVVGPQTIAAVKKFQSARGLPPTGIIDSNTLKAGQFGVPTDVGSSASSSVKNPLSSLSGGAFTLATTGDYQSGAYPAQKAQALDEVRKAFPNFNPAVAQANAKAIQDQTTQQADVTRGITAADSNFGLLTNTFKGKVNNPSSPLVNQLNNFVQAGAIGNSDVINFKSAVSTLQTEYATVLGRGGEVTDAVRNSAANVINGNYSMNDLVSLHDYIDKEGANVISSYNDTIKDLVSGGTGSSNNNSGTSGGSTYNGITLPN